MSKIHRRRVLKATGATLAGVSLAGCSSGGDGGDSPDTIKIGVLVPEDHPLASDTIEGAEYIINQYNDDGGLLGADIEYTIGDTQLDPETAIEETRRLTQQEDVDFLTGGFTSEATLSIQQQIAGSGPIFLSSSAGTTELSERVADNHDQYRYWFTPVPRSPDVFRNCATLIENHVASEIGAESVVLLAEDLEWTAGLTDYFTEALSDLEVADEIRFAFDTTDFSPILSDAASSDGEIMVPFLTVGEMNTLVQQWASVEHELPLAGGVLPTANSDSFPDQVGGSAENISASQFGFRAPITDITLDFVEGYVEEFGSEPATTAWLTYDALLPLFESIKAAETIEDDELIEELENGSWTGANGTIEFQADDGEFPHSVNTDDYRYTQMQWQEDDEGNLRRVALGPDDWADHDGEQAYQLPPWLQ